jgi:hypothetical protein
MAFYADVPAVPGPIAGAGRARPDLGGRWPYRLVATASENRLKACGNERERYRFQNANLKTFLRGVTTE